MSDLPEARPGAGAALSRVTRIAAVVSAIVAVVLAASLESRAWPPLLYLVLAVFAGVAAAARFVPAIAHAVVFATAFVSPVLLFALGYFSPYPWTLWVAALLALALAGGYTSGWSLPRAWQLPLAGWALVVAVTWPIVALREMDFDPALLDAHRISVTGQGIPPAVQIAWIASMAAAQLIGFLWLDAMFGRFRSEPGAFRRQVMWPLVGGGAVSAAVALYQWSVDMTFLNATVYAYLHRAVGTMFDANAHGTAVAVAMGIAVPLALQMRSRSRVLFLGAALLLFFPAVWASASRSALLAAVSAGAGVGWLWTMAPGGTRSARRLAVIPLVLFAGVMLSQVLRPPKLAEGQLPIGPLQRTFTSLFARGERDFRDAFKELLRRDGYGPIADRMIEEHPLTGVGIGSFHGLTLDYGPFVGENVPTDNAQNLIRHHLAELGVLGGMGLIVWLPMFLFGLAAPPRSSDPLPARLISFPIAGLLLASMVGFPTQNPALLATLWTLAFWHVQASGRPAVPETGRGGWPAWAWTAVMAVVLLHAAATLVAARDELRVPNRAARFGWVFERGFHPLEAGGGIEFRWSRRRGIIAIPARGPYLRLTYWVHHPDASTRPVHVQLRAAGNTVVDEWLSDHQARVVYVRMKDGISLEVEVDRTWTPPGGGGELGVGFADWRFVPSPPRGAAVVDPWQVGLGPAESPARR